MKRIKLKKICTVLMMSIILLLILQTKANANDASLKVSVSKTTVSPGETFTVTVSVSNGAGYVNLSASNGTLSSTGPIDLMLKTSDSVTCTAGSSGTVTITASGVIADYATATDESKSDSASVTIASSSSSTDNSSSTTTTATTSAPTLSVLGITPYDFSGFKSGTTSYSVTVPNDCTSVSIYAKTNSSGATITGTGTVTLKEGTNKYTVTVSNSAGSKSYTLSIIRQSEESEIVANSSDEEETENESSSGIGLDSLTITGYELNEEFNTNTYEYTVTVGDEITEELLEEIKSKIFWTANSEDVNVEYEIEVSEDGTSGTITLVVKDEEREYSRYVITFSNEELNSDDEEKVAIAGTTSSNNSGNDGTTTGLDSTTKKGIALIGCIILISGFGVYFAVNSYIKSRNLEEYENGSENGDIANIVESIMKEKEEKGEINTGIGEFVEQPEEKIPAMQEASATDSNNEDDLKQSNTADLLKDSTEKLADLGGYRKYRKGLSGGRH